MAEEGVFSLKQRYPTMDIERTFGIPQDCLLYTSPSPRD